MTLRSSSKPTLRFILFFINMFSNEALRIECGYRHKLNRISRCTTSQKLLVRLWTNLYQPLPKGSVPSWQLRIFGHTTSVFFQIDNLYSLLFQSKTYLKFLNYFILFGCCFSSNVIPSPNEPNVFLPPKTQINS
jgi:hypothetical protein